MRALQNKIVKILPLETLLILASVVYLREHYSVLNVKNWTFDTRVRRENEKILYQTTSLLFDLQEKIMLRINIAIIIFFYERYFEKHHTISEW